MIRYDVSIEYIRTEIAKIDSRWQKKAMSRERKITAAGRYAEKSSIWHTVKPVYMELQKFKCVFCERQFENKNYGKIEFDVEHFRPKSSANPWPESTAVTYEFGTGAALLNGYHWLAYDIENYAVSCKVCNTLLKSNFFPIGASRGLPGSNFRQLEVEKAFLCYPLGKLDDNPENLMTFVATTAVPRAADGHKRRRGQIIIDFFRLNARDQLHRQRAQMISIFGGAFAAINSDNASSQDHKVAKHANDPALPHASCIRAFNRLWKTDPKTAKRVYEVCREYAISETNTAPPEI